MNIQTNTASSGVFSPAFCLGFGQYDSHHKPTIGNGTGSKPNPKFGQPFNTVSFNDIAAFVHTPSVVAKGSGAWMLASAYTEPDARVFSTQADKGSYGALLVDIDRGFTQLPRLVEVLQGLLAGTRVLIHSSSSATPTTPKWHCIIPLKSPIPFVAFNKFQLALFDGLEANDILCDRTLARAAQLFYLPSVTTTGAYYEFIDVAGEPYDPRDTGHWLHVYAANLYEVELSKSKATQQEDGHNSVIGWWRTHGTQTEDLLLHYGYTFDGKEYASPMQQEGGKRHSTMVREDGSWFSMSHSDEAAGIGVPHRDGVHGDSFELLKFYGFDNKFQEALDWVKEQREAADEAMPSVRAFVEGLSK
jgi:hypothetical protein